MVVGHGTGGTLAWAMAALHPGTTTAVAVLASPHPARMRLRSRAAFTTAALRELAYLQVPTLPERALAQGDLVERTLALGAATPLPDDVVDLYKAVMRIPFAAHSAAERCAGPFGPRHGWTAAGSARRCAVRSDARAQLQGSRDGSCGPSAPTSTPSRSRRTCITN